MRLLLKNAVPRQAKFQNACKQEWTAALSGEDEFSEKMLVLEVHKKERKHDWTRRFLRIAVRTIDFVSRFIYHFYLHSCTVVRFYSISNTGAFRNEKYDNFFYYGY